MEALQIRDRGIRRDLKAVAVGESGYPVRQLLSPSRLAYLKTYGTLVSITQRC